MNFGLFLRLSVGIGMSLLWVSPAVAQNLELGPHIGIGWLEDATPLGSETAAERGLQISLWPVEGPLAISADWSYLPRDDYQESFGDSLVGETDRNRQIVDLTLQYHVRRGNRFGAFLEAGGGALWNNRDVVNPDNLPDFEEPGKESTRRAIWTVGGGIRARLAPHLNWIGQLKLHSPGSDSRQTVRVFTGLMLSWK